jgi:hypothetical protein
MTISEILEFDSAKLASITDEEYEKIFAPYFNVTRPEYASKQPGSAVNYISPEKRIAFEKVKVASGLDIAAMMADIKRRKKK